MDNGCGICCIECWRAILKFGTFDVRKFMEEQKIVQVDGIMQDEVEKRRDFEIEFLAGAYINKVAESDALKKKLALQVQGRRERVDEERQMVRDAERVWNESASERVFGKWLNCVERRILTQYKI